ncbi:MAG: serine/threonine-protein kinase [Nocardioidaceae bacterium]
MSPPSESPAESGRIGRYSLLSKVGEGGMGVVHLAQSPAGERVALKVLRPHIVGDDEGRARLAREVTSLRRVRSRRVAEVHDADPWGEQPFVVTRYVDGPSLHERVRTGGPLAGPELHSVAVGLVEAVVAVHEVGVLHRDIKPSNVLLEGSDPVLIDFGLAKLADDSRLTATGWLMGTPGYLAPEVLYGDEASPAADVHSWAATVVYAATGSTPFGRGPSMAIMDRARRGEHDLSTVPDDLRPLLARCLAPAPADRPGAREVLAELTGPPQPTAVPPAEQTRPLTVPVARPRPAPPPREPERGPTRRSRPAIRLLLLGGLPLLFATGFALAPYVALAVGLLVTWLLRTGSWSSDAMADRRALKGERPSDGLVRTVTAPWHLLVSFPGTLLLLLAASSTAALLATVLWALGTPDARALLVGGLAGALVLWWGPGSRRLRRPLRRAVWRVSRPEAAGEVWAGLLFGVVVVLVLALVSAGVLWWPDTGPPFDPQDLLP